MYPLFINNTITQSRVNKELVKLFLKEVYENDNLSIVDELIAVDFITHNWPQELQGREGFKVYYQNLKKVLPGARYIIKDLIAEKDRVVVYWRVEVNQQKLDQASNDSTQKRLSLEGAIIYRLEKEQLKECRMISNHYYHKKY